MDRIGRAYRDREPALVEAVRRLGGGPADFGDVSGVVPALPRVSVMAVLWRGDDEFPAPGTMLFDSTVVEYLPMEDIVVLAGMVATGLTT